MPTTDSDEAYKKYGRDYHRAWRRKNIDRLRRQLQEKKAADPEGFRARQRKYNLTYRRKHAAELVEYIESDYAKARSREYYIANKERIKAAGVRYRQTERYAQWLKSRKSDAAFVALRRERGRAYDAGRRDRRKEDPAALAAYRERSKEYHKQYYQKRKAALMADPAAVAAAQALRREKALTRYRKNNIGKN